MKITPRVRRSRSSSATATANSNMARFARAWRSTNAALPYNYKWQDTLDALTNGRSRRARPARQRLARVHSSCNRRPNHADDRLLGSDDSARRTQSASPYEQHHLSCRPRRRRHIGRKIKTSPKELTLERARLLFVPSWNWHRFENKSSKDAAILFSVTDRPVLESLGLFREEE